MSRRRATGPPNARIPAASPAAASPAAALPEASAPVGGAPVGGAGITGGAGSADPAAAAGLPDDGFVASYLSYLLAAASEQLSTGFHRIARAEGLRAPEWRILACLSDGDGLTVGALARLTLLEQSRLTKILHSLEGEGLVARVDDAADRRRVRLALTPAGRSRVAPLLVRARAHEAGVTRCLSGAELASLKAMLRRLIAAGDAAQAE